MRLSTELRIEAALLKEALRDAEYFLDTKDVSRSLANELLEFTGTGTICEIDTDDDGALVLMPSSAFLALLDKLRSCPPKESA